MGIWTDGSSADKIEAGERLYDDDLESILNGVGRWVDRNKSTNDWDGRDQLINRKYVRVYVCGKGQQSVSRYITVAANTPDRPHPGPPRTIAYPSRRCRHHRRRLR